MDYDSNTLRMTNDFDLCNVSILTFWQCSNHITDFQILNNKVCIFTWICIPT